MKKEKDKKKKPVERPVVQFPKLGMASHLLAMTNNKKFGQK